MVNKLLRIGDSVGVTLPKKTLKEMGISTGDKVVITFVPKDNSFVITPFKTNKSVVSNRIAKLPTEFIDRYRPALKKLAND